MTLPLICNISYRIILWWDHFPRQFMFYTYTFSRQDFWKDMGAMGLLGMTAPGMKRSERTKWVSSRWSRMGGKLWAYLLCLVFSGVRRHRSGLPGSCHCDGGNVESVRSRRPKLWRPLQPVCQSDGAPWQRRTEGEVYAEGEHPTSVACICILYTVLNEWNTGYTHSSGLYNSLHIRYLTLQFWPQFDLQFGNCNSCF